MLEEGLSYPFKGDNSLGRNIIGGLLLVFFWLIIPLLVFFGYIIRVLRSTAAGREDPPPFDDWGEMIVDGLKSMIIFFAYAIVPYALLFGLAFFLGVASGVSGEGGSGIIAGIGILSFLWFLVALVVVQYVLPAALTNFAREGQMSAAFDIETIGDVILSTEYLIAWLLPIVVFVIVYIIMILLAFTIVGILLWPWLIFYMYVVVYRMFGRAYVQALGLGDETPESTTDPAV